MVTSRTVVLTVVTEHLKICSSTTQRSAKVRLSIVSRVLGTVGMTEVDVKVEPISPPATISHGMTNVDIKAEPISPPTTTPHDMTNVDIKVEPNSPPTALPHGMTGVDIKVEPSSPSPTLPEHVDANEKGPAEAALESSSSETSKDIMDKSLGTSERATGPSQKKPQGSAKRLLECDTCGRCFKTRYQLKTHQRVHTGEKQHKCDTCGQWFASKNSLSRHQVLHTGEKPHACPECGRKFAHKGTLNQHHKFVHMKRRLYTCPVCDQKFPLKFDLRRHKHVHTGEMPYACQICPSKFCRKASLVKHKQLHAAGVQVGICAECGKSFKSMKSLLNHLKWHNMEKPHSCHLCPARFTKKSNLEKHVFTHKGEKPYKCPLCERLFSTSANVKMHMHRIHSGVEATVASTDSMAGVATPSKPLVTEPREDADMNEAGPSTVACGRSTSVMPQTSGTEISGDITNSHPG